MGTEEATANPASPGTTKRQASVLRWGLLLAALLANVWAPSVVPGVQYWPGSLFVLLTVSLYGWRWGLAAALGSVLPLGVQGGMIGLMGVLLLEPLAVGWGLRRVPRGNVFLIDGVFWLLLGGPLLWGLAADPTRGDVPLAALVALYQALVGTTNALLAGLLLCLGPLALWAGQAQWRLPFRTALFYFAGGIALALTFVLLTLEGRGAFSRVDRAAREALQESRHAVEQQMAQRLGAVPLTETEVAQTLTEIFIAEASLQDVDMAFVGADGELLASTYAAHRQDELRTALRAADARTRGAPQAQWFLVPAEPSGFQAWYQAHRQMVWPMMVGDVHGVLLLSHPLGPLLAHVYRNYVQMLLAALAMLVLGLGVTWGLGRWLVRPLQRLGAETAALPDRLQSAATTAHWPDSRIQEVAALAASVQDMDRRLRQAFQASTRANQELQQSNRQLALEVQERQAAEAALAESEGRFRQLSEHLHHAVLWMTSADGRELLYVSPTYERIAGHSLQHLYEGWPWSWLASLHPEDRAVLTRNMKRTLETGALFPEEGGAEYRIVRPDGEVRWIRGVGFPIRNEAGEVYRCGGLAIDITAQKAAEDQVRQHQDELAHMARVSLASEMASGLAHELNQPLTAINMSAHTLKAQLHGGRLEPKASQVALERIESQATRAADIIQRLRAMVGRRALSRQPESLNRLVEGVLTLVDADLRYQRVRLNLELDDTLPWALIDRVQVEQVVLNLIRNAGEAMQAVPPPSRELTVRTVALGEEVAIEVADRGPGISAAVAEHLFQPFQTTKEKGMGVGLWISRAIIERHRGTLTVANRTDGGAVFTVTLPRADGADMG